MSADGRTFLYPLVSRTDTAAAIANERTGLLLATSVEVAFDSAARRRGLLGRNGLPWRHAIAIAPTNAIHTWFMRFPIDVVFVARDGTVVAFRRGLRPWRVAIAVKAFCAIELASGSIDACALAVGDRLVATKLAHQQDPTAA